MPEVIVRFDEQNERDAMAVTNHMQRFVCEAFHEAVGVELYGLSDITVEPRRQLDFAILPTSMSVEIQNNDYGDYGKQIATRVAQKVEVLLVEMHSHRPNPPGKIAVRCVYKLRPMVAVTICGGKAEASVPPVRRGPSTI